MRTGVVTALVLLVALAIGCGNSGTKTVTVASPDALPVVLPEEVTASLCHRAHEHPERFALGCGMGMRTIDLKWRHWGEPVSYAYGIARINDCYPSCAEGHYTDHKIQLIAFQIETCASGQRRYTRLTWTFPEGNPSGEESEPGQQEFDIPCPST
jgi:hypothetical protein